MIWSGGWAWLHPSSLVGRPWSLNCSEVGAFRGKSSPSSESFEMLEQKGEEESRAWKCVEGIQGRHRLYQAGTGHR